MSLTSAMFTGVSGLTANANGINVISNNLANINTIGYKAARTVFSDLLSESIGNNAQVGKGTQIQAVDNLFSQGTTETTSLTTDLSITGDSFFVLGGSAISSTTTYTAPTSATGTRLSRAGAFSLVADTVTADQYNLVNADGLPVLDSNGAPISVTSATAGLGVTITKIDSTGVITAKDTTGAAATVSGTGIVGTLAVVDKSKLTKLGGSVYSVAAGAWPTVPTTYASVDGSNEKVVSNSLEQSNVDMASEMVKLILTQRAYSANSKTITTADEMTQEVIGLKR